VRTDLSCQISGEIPSAIISREVAQGLSPSVQGRVPEEPPGYQSHRGFVKLENRDLVVLEILENGSQPLISAGTRVSILGGIGILPIGNFRGVEPLRQGITICNFSIRSVPSVLGMGGSDWSHREKVPTGGRPSGHRRSGNHRPRGKSIHAL
jgi:hypothetical protein